MKFMAITLLSLQFCVIRSVRHTHGPGIRNLVRMQEQRGKDELPSLLWPLPCPSSANNA